MTVARWALLAGCLLGGVAVATGAFGAHGLKATLAATGRHLAVWVDGVQVTDWTDDRPADENPRKGARTAAGHVSLQGHDPTTDLDFRGIVVAELPPAAP